MTAPRLRILLVGASGVIGNWVHDALRTDHEVIAAGLEPARGPGTLQRVHTPCFHNAATWAPAPQWPAGRAKRWRSAPCTPSSLLVHYMTPELWAAIEPGIEATQPELIEVFEFVVRRCRAAADRNRPADADRAFKNLDALVTAYLG